MSMQSLSLTFRRLYATTLPGPALVARTQSTPQAVRLRRRLRKRQNLPPITGSGTDATPAGLTPTEHDRYLRLKATGGLGKIGKELSENQWVKALNARRSRLRGLRQHKQKDGTMVTAVVGQRVYLPNIIFRLVRNQTPPGKPYNPYEATFRVPLAVTKTDIRSYLLTVYGVKTTYIRTDIYYSPTFRMGNGGYTTKSYRTYKRAVVGLVDPFHYPLRLEDMSKEEREKREKWIEDKFAIKQNEWQQKYELLRLTRTTSGSSPGWKWRGPLVANRAQILKLVGERRAKREGLIASTVSEWHEKRLRGEPIELQAKK